MLHAPAIRLTKTVLFPLFFYSLPYRLTDPIPTTETSIAPRQRPKAGQTQPNPGILPIQPALTPRKRPTVQAAIQPQGEMMFPVQSHGAVVHLDLTELSCFSFPTSCRPCCPGQWSALAPCKCSPAKSSTSTGSSTATSQASGGSAASPAGTAPGSLYSATSHTSASAAAFLEAAAPAATAAAATTGCLLPAAADDAGAAGKCAQLCLLHAYCARDL